MLWWTGEKTMIMTNIYSRMEPTGHNGMVSCWNALWRGKQYHLKLPLQIKLFSLVCVLLTGSPLLTPSAVFSHAVHFSAADWYQWVTCSAISGRNEEQTAFFEFGNTYRQTPWKVGILNAVPASVSGQSASNEKYRGRHCKFRLLFSSCASWPVLCYWSGCCCCSGTATWSEVFVQRVLRFVSVCGSVAQKYPAASAFSMFSMRNILSKLIVQLYTVFCFIIQYVVSMH